MFPLIAKKLKIVLVLFIIPAFISGSLSPAQAASVKAVVQYTDIKNHWAEFHINRLATMGVLGLFKGRTFYPDQAVNKLEALALTMKTSGFSPAPKKPAATGNKKVNTISKERPAWETNMPAWGRSYVYLAVEKGFIPDPAKESFDFDKPITRIELTRLLARVLNIVPPVNTQTLATQVDTIGETGSTQATFTDENLVPEADRTLLRAVVDAGIMSVYPDGSFSPHQPVTRAELVSIISGLIDLGWIGNNSKQSLEGWISQVIITKKNQELELSSLSNTKKYKLSRTVKCYKNGLAWPISQAALHRCEIVLDSNKQVSWINLFEQKTTVANPDIIRGSVKKLLLGNKNYLVINDLSCEDHLLPLSWDVKIFDDDAVKNISSLKAGEFVDVEVHQNQVSKVTLLETKTLSDTVEAILSGRLDLKTDVSNTKPGWINHWDMARIVNKDGVPRSDVLVDDKIEVIYLDPFPKEIDDEIPLQIMITNK